MAIVRDTSEDMGQLIDQLVDSLPGDSALLHTVLYHLVKAGAGGGYANLGTILRRSDMWLHVARRCGSSPDRWRNGSLFHNVLTEVYGTVVTNATEVQDNTVTLASLQTISKKMTSFLGLLKGFTVANADGLRAAALAKRDELKSFDTTLAQVQCFVNYFCACGVDIDVQEMRVAVSDLTNRYDRLQLGEVQGRFDNIPPELREAIPWLYGLRASALFLSLWRKVGQAILKSVQPALDAVGGACY